MFDPLSPPEGYKEWLSQTRSKKLPKLSKMSSPTIRKYNYEVSYTDRRSIENFTFKWEYVFPIYEFDWTLNFEFNFVIDLMLNFDFSIDSWFTNNFAEWFGELGLEFSLSDMPLFEEVSKGTFGRSRYGRAYFDPPELSPENLLQLAKEIRTKLLSRSDYDYRFDKDAMSKVINSIKEILKNHNVSEVFIQYLISRLFHAESVLKYNSFVNLAVVDYSIVLHPTNGSTGVAYSVIRNTETFEPDQFIEVNTPYDTIIGYAYVNVNKVMLSREMLYEEYGKEENIVALPPTLVEYVSENVDIGKNHLGVSKLTLFGTELPYLPARHRYYIHGEKIAKKGGVHQAVMQNYINKVKQILDQEGIVGVERLNYISFANEVLYLRHEGVRKNKTWKKNIDIDALVEKYINLGANEDILWKVVKICQRE